MNELVMREKIHQAVDQHCAHLQDNPWLAQRVLEAANEPAVRRGRKMSVAVAVVLVLVMLTATATAAVLLSRRQFVEEHLIPIANEYEGETFTLEDTNWLVRLAEENGIELSEYTLNAIEAYQLQGEGYFKEEILMDMAKNEFGWDMNTWTLEQWKWFDEACSAIGFEWDDQHDMPEGGEDAKYPIIEAAIAHIKATYDQDALLDDPEQYTIVVAYLVSEDTEYEHYWSINFESRAVENASYFTQIADDGSIIASKTTPGLNGSMRVAEIKDLYTQTFGYSEEWSQATLRAFQAAVMTATDKDYRSYLCISQTSYPDIPADAISRKQVEEIAAEYMQFPEYRISELYLIGDEPNPVWKISIVSSKYYRIDQEVWSLQIDCITGEVKLAKQVDDNHLKWWMPMVLWEISDDVDSHWVDKSPSVG